MHALHFKTTHSKIEIKKKTKSKENPIEVERAKEMNDKNGSEIEYERDS